METAVLFERQYVIRDALGCFRFVDICERSLVHDLKGQAKATMKKATVKRKATGPKKAAGKKQSAKKVATRKKMGVGY